MTTQFYAFPSPAKLNLFLHVNGVRDDGYHELQTLFQFLDYGDTIEFRPTDHGKIHLLTPIAGIENQHNLIVRAALLLQNHLKEHQPQHLPGVDIRITKILPMGGGLGGGSSNAATVLLALNQLWHAGVSADELATMGLRLGADVPIFIHGFSAVADGVGEKLQPFYPDEVWYLVTKPPCSISTASVFQSPDLPRNTAKIPLENIDIAQCHNDCQTMVTKHYPEVAKLLSWLVEYAPSRMTGTGACIFSRFTSKSAAQLIQAQLPQGITSFIAKGINQSPLINVISALVPG